ncbi:MAG: phage holin family protein [Tissierellia bacterium]|nr:phage holin family protein [Tissierellia bacterium]
MKDKQSFGLIGFIMRLIVSMIVIASTNILVPGMSNSGGIKNLAIAAIVIALLQNLFAMLSGASKTSKGISGFLVMAIVLYLTGKFVDGYNVSIIGALLGGLVYGIIDAMIPGQKLY